MDRLIKYVSGSDTLLYLHIILLLFIIIVSILIVVSLIQNNTIQKVKDNIDESVKARTEREELLRKSEGAQDKENVFYKIDLMLNQSGIKNKIRFFAPEYLLLCCSLIVSISFAIGIIFQRILFSLVIGISICVGIILCLVLKANSNYRKVENQLIHFLNLVENYTKSEDNIITIFGKVYPYLQEPLASAVKVCYAEANNTGDMVLAFRRLDTKIGHEKFSEILRNIELCSKYEANYQAVVSTSREIMTSYTKSKRKIKNITEEAIIDLAIMIMAMAILFGVIDSFIDGSLLQILTSGVIGIAILGYIAIVLIYSLFSILAIVRK